MNTKVLKQLPKRDHVCSRISCPSYDDACFQSLFVKGYFHKILEQLASGCATIMQLNPKPRVFHLPLVVDIVNGKSREVLIDFGSPVVYGETNRASLRFLVIFSFILN